jgi:hypothetical protein
MRILFLPFKFHMAHLFSTLKLPAMITGIADKINQKALT